MDKWHKILLASTLILGIMVLLQRCNSECPDISIEKKTVVSHETVIDTTFIEVEKPVYRYFSMPVPAPYRDSVIDTFYVQSFLDEDFDEVFRYASIYEDSIRDDTATLYYKLKIRGILDEVKLGYKLNKISMVNRTDVIETEVTRRIKGRTALYFGMDIGGNKDQFGHMAPMVELHTWRYNYNVGYNLIDKSFIVGMRMRIAKKRKIL